MEKSEKFFFFGTILTLSMSIALFVYILSQRNFSEVKKIEINIQETVKKDKIPVELDCKPTQVL